MSGRRHVILNGERHETAMTEYRGQFCIYCGCGWSSGDGDISTVIEAARTHVQRAGIEAVR